MLLRQGHAYQARWLAPVPCQLLGSAPSVSSLLSAMLQQLGGQFGRSQAWSTVRGDTSELAGWSPPAGHEGAASIAFNECTVYTEATWQAPDTAVDPSLATLPGLGLVPLVDMWDAQTGELVYDRSAIAQPSSSPPGTAPAPPAQQQPPAATTVPATTVTAAKPSGGGGAGLAIGVGIGLLVLGAIAVAVSRS